MSNTYMICCDDCKVKLWYGQNSGDRNYSYEKDGKDILVEFLLNHSHHRLHSYDDYGGECDEFDSDEYEIK